jgi:NAD(P) transhydrogenase
MEHYDLIVIGSGPAGEKGAAQAAYFGKRVALVERSTRLGGAPVNSGGLPTKTLRETALYLTGFRQRDLYGIGMDIGPELTLDRLHARAARVSEVAGAAVRRNVERHGIDLVTGSARLGPDGEVVVEAADGSSTSMRADVILIATGSRPYRPADVPFDHPDVHDSDSILDLKRLPRNIVVIGGGPVGSEYASIFTALGAQVTLIDRGSHLMPFLDREISEQLATCFTDMGMRLLVGSPQARVTTTEDGLRVDVSETETLRPDAVLYAAGRSGNTEDLGLAELGIEVDARGRIIVDDEYQTTRSGVFAAGDVIGPPALASVSAEQGRVAMCHAFEIPFKETVDPLPPFCIYTLPEVGMVGLTEEAAAAAGVEVEVGRASFADNPRSVIAGTTAGMIKLVFDARDRRLLGVHIVGEEAGELIHAGQAVIHSGETIDRFIHTTFALPTRSDVYKYAAYDGLGRLRGSQTLAAAASVAAETIA